MEATRLERSILIAAPQERVWEVLTDPAKIVRWFVPNLPDAEMKREDSGKLVVYLYGMGVDFLTLEVVDAPHQMMIRSLPDQLLTATYTLEAQQEGTHVNVTLTGLEALSKDGDENRLHLIGESWDKTLTNLKAYVHGVDLPIPNAFVGPLFGYWREPIKKIAIERSVWIDAPRERVWRALIDPQQLQQWYSPTTEWQLSALEIGGRFYVQNAETNTEMYVEVIEVLDPSARLVTRCLPEPTDTAVKTKVYTLIEEKGGTRLTLTLVGYEQESDDTRWNRMEENAFGFGMMLQNTKAHVEGKALPFPNGF